MSFSERLKKLRAQAGLTQDALAQEAGMTGGGLRHIEHGISGDPKWSTVVALAKALSVPTDAFKDDFKDDDEAPPAPVEPPPPTAEPAKKRKRKGRA